MSIPFDSLGSTDTERFTNLITHTQGAPVSTTDKTTDVPDLRDGTETIASTATVSASATVREHAQVRDMAHVLNTAKVMHSSRVLDCAQIHDHAVVINHGLVYGSGRVYGHAVVDGGEVGGNAYLGDGARVRDSAIVHAGIFDLTADVASARHFLSIGPVGSENRTATFFRAYSPEAQGWVGVIAAGCFRGTTDKLTQRLDAGHGWSSYNYTNADLARFDAEYRSLIELARQREAAWESITPTELDWWTKRLSSMDRSWLVQRLDEYGIA